MQLFSEKGEFFHGKFRQNRNSFSDHHFPKDACRFLFDVAMFNQTLLPGRGAEHTAVTSHHSGDSPCLGKPQHYTVPRTIKTLCAGLAGAPNLGQPHWEGPSRWVKPVVGSEALLIA